MNRFLILSFFFISLTSFGQIQVGGDVKEEKPEKKEKAEKPKKEKQSDEATEVFLGANWSKTNRRLETNKNIFGDSIGERENEIGINTWSGSIGIRTKINQFLLFEGGISYLQNGEKYDFQGTDTSFSYTNKYNFIGMPLKLYYYYEKNNFRFQVGVGGIPQMALKFSQETRSMNSEGAEETSSIKTKVGVNSFVFSAVANIGFQYEFMPTWSVYLLPEYRVQLNSSYLNSNKFKHYGNALGVSFGLVKAL